MCPYLDKLCPCPDGDACHYDGNKPWSAPTLQQLMVRAREHIGLSQKEFAKRLGVSPQYVCDLEHGRRLGSVQYVDAVCDLIGAWPSMRKVWHHAGARAHGWQI